MTITAADWPPTFASGWASPRNSKYYRVAGPTTKWPGKPGRAERALLVCGSGMGMAIVANKAPGVYAAVCENVEAARKARSINNSNVLTLGEMVTSAELAQEIVKVWLDPRKFKVFCTTRWGASRRSKNNPSPGRIFTI